MERKRLLKTTLSLLLAFTMTFAPLFGSYSAIAFAAGTDQESTASSETTTEASEEESSTEEAVTGEEPAQGSEEKTEESSGQEEADSDAEAVMEEPQQASDDADIAENENSPKALLNASPNDVSDADAEETLPSGTYYGIKWKLERNENDAIVLALDYGGSTSVREYFFQNIKSSLGEYAGQIEELVVNKRIKSIGTYAFRDVTSLKKITLANTVETIGGWAFSGCKSLEELDLPIVSTDL